MCGLFLVVVLGLLIAVATLVKEHGLWIVWALVAVVHGLSCSEARGIFLDQGLNPVPCVGRWILNHWTTRKVLWKRQLLYNKYIINKGQFLTGERQWQKKFLGEEIDSAPSEAVRERGEGNCIRYLILGLRTQAGIVVLLLWLAILILYNVGLDSMSSGTSARTLGAAKPPDALGSASGPAVLQVQTAPSPHLESTCSRLANVWPGGQGQV